MIDKALEFLHKQLNDYIQLKTGDDDKLVLSNVVKPGGDMDIPNGSLGLTLINIEEERIGKTYGHPNLKNGNAEYKHPEIRLNLYILICANFVSTNYIEGVRLLSYASGFFQKKRVFDQHNSSELDENITRLIVDLNSLSFEQQNHLWGTIGAKFLPSVCYKIRLVTIDENEMLEKYPVVKDLDSKLTSK
jgi:hypothetical protein